MSVAILFFLLILSLSNTFEITSKTLNDLDQFPKQVYNPRSRSSFFREYRNGTVEVIHCPSGYFVHIKEVICVAGLSLPRDPSGREVNKKREAGRWPNPDNCATFINCNQDYCYTMDCPDNLLYSNVTGRCESPLVANCCEYLAKNPDQLVQGR